MNGDARSTSLIGGLEYETVRPVIETLDSLSSDKSVKGIKLTLTSSGGWFHSAFTLFDYIKSYSKPVNIIATGCCHSSAILVLQAGAKRLSRPHTDFQFHRVVHEVAEATSEDIKTKLVGFKRQEEVYFDTVAKRTKLSSSQIKRLCSTERSFGPEEALDWGLIDEIEKPG